MTTWNLFSFQRPIQIRSGIQRKYFITCIFSNFLLELISNLLNNTSPSCLGDEILNSTIYFLLGNIYKEKGDLITSELYLTKSIKADENNVNAYFLRGAVRNLQGRFKEAIEDYLSLGVPKNKMLIGLAFYGITEDYVENEWVRGKAVRYTDIKNLEQDDNYTKEYDDKAKVHYLLAKNKQSFICYDSVFTIKLKCEYIKSEGVGGVMYWQNGQDLTGELLKTIKESI